MIIKLFGVFDILTGLIFWLFAIFNIDSFSSFVLLLGMILLVKGFAFGFNFNIASVLDIISSFIIIYASTNEISNIIVIIVSIFLLQKGVFSLLG